jgi:superfamily I DNA/RNA helicase
MPVTHDVYLKAWQLSKPRLPWCDTVMYDEAQDATPAMLSVVRDQPAVQAIYVGDPHQQIYEFRGAVNALASLDLPMYALTRTWRFGASIAAVANAILRAKGETRSVRPGRAREDQARPGYSQAVDTILARTNVGLVEQALRLVDRRLRFFIRGGINHETGVAGNGFMEIRGKLLAAYDLRRKKQTTHPAFEMYASWEDLRDTAQEDGGEALRPFVRLVEQHAANIPTVVAKLRDNCAASEAEADVVLSTVHRFKGEEADRVALAADYRKFSYEEKKSKRKMFDEGEANIAYVAVTRARQELWIGGAQPAIEESLEHAGVKRIFEVERGSVKPS